MLPINFISLFLAIVASFIIFFLIKDNRYKWVSLLAGSLLFYWLTSGKWIIFLVVYSLAVFGCGHLVKKKNSRYHWHYFLILLLVLVPLLLYKLLPYLPWVSNFAFEELPIEYKSGIGELTEIIGISYITFNAISYLADIRRGYINPEKNFFLFLLYISFFPVVFAGPLHKAKNLLVQFRENLRLSNENFSLGFRLVLFGAFKNFVLAERLLAVTTSLTKQEVKGLYVLIEGFSFFLYLYCVFSSYVDISRGIARLFGINVENNFANRVYAASSRQAFWKGWHITLNNWFRDYFFFPLAKKLTIQSRINVSLFITFIFIGLWHGISFRFFLWGCLNGLWIILEKKFKKHFNFIHLSWRKKFGMLYHLSIAALLALIFSSVDLHKTCERLLTKSNIEPARLLVLIRQFAYISVFFLAMDFFYIGARGKLVEVYLGEMPLLKRWALYFIMVLVILFFGINMAFNNYYFRF